jgi:anti-sigma B factor antagonist
VGSVEVDLSSQFAMKVRLALHPLSNSRTPDKGLPLSATDPITTSVGYRDGIAVLTVGGEIDLVTAPALEEAISGVVATGPAALVVDLSAVDFLASAGLKLLAATHEKMGESAQFAVVARGPTTRRPIHLTGLDKTFSVYPTLDDALTGLQDSEFNQ